ncbi:MAG: hypothetical protein KC800_26460 [Candidatus Eremiobacteraeota bacterium]|nr:hypothetical protein [Candidatus Eremiobacteraeota bacterium]
MGFIKILRWRVGSRPPRRSRRARGIETDSLHRAAVFLAVLGEEHTTLLFEKFEDEETRLLQSEVNSVSEADRSMVSDVLHEFLVVFSTDHLPQYVSRDDLQDVARAFVRSQPEDVVDRMRELWLQDEFEEQSFDEDSLLELDFEALEPAQKAAVFMMWLPPELSAMVLAEFPSNLVHLVTGILVELPFVKPEARERVLAEFMEDVSLGIPGLSVDDVGLPVVVETFVRSDPRTVAKRLESMWLREQAIVSAPTAEKVKVSPIAELSSLEKAAVFLQSLSLPLSYKLLSIMEENEVELLLETVEKLGGVEADIRKAVLQELMLVTRGAEAEAQPIHILGKAMGQMIRRKPEAVVNRLRQHWLAEG